MESQEFTTTKPSFYYPGQQKEILYSVELLEKLDSPEPHLIRKECGVIQTTPKAITIAISGCSSSGKTTLALLLSEIFSSSPTTKDSTGNESPHISEKNNLGDAKATHPYTTTIHQDAFFIPKADCPLVQFNSGPNDEHFVKESLAQENENPVYFYARTGTNGEENVQITGPNTDCMEAINFGNLLRMVQTAQANDAESDMCVQYKDDADKKKLIEQYSGVIESMRRRVREYLALRTGNRKRNDIVADYNCAWVFVEGFLLFTKVSPSDDRSSWLDAFLEVEDRCAGLSENVRREFKKEAALKEDKVMRAKEEMAVAKAALMQEFDIKLFLPTSKEVAKERRLSRFPYIDFPAGGRCPGQMWKSEGYFEEVVWKGYEDSFGWLLRETGKENVDGVFVRTTVDDTIENTVYWAVDIILRFLRGGNGIGRRWKKWQPCAKGYNFQHPKPQRRRNLHFLICLQPATMSHLYNPLATAQQLYQNTSNNRLPAELQDSIRFYTARLTQAAGILLGLPQDITAQANVLLYRYWLADDLMQYEYSDVSAATLYLTAKVSASPRSFRSITNVYAYLLSQSATLTNSHAPDNNPSSYYLSESAYITYRTRLLNIEGQVLNALGFNTHVALPHPLAITYLQTLDIFSPAHKNGSGKAIAKKTIQYLNTALLSPQMLYLTHQPCALAVAAIYLAAKEEGIKMPEDEWWEVFDVEREELGFLVVGMRSLEGVARRGKEIFGEKMTIAKDDIMEELGKRGLGPNNGTSNGQSKKLDEEDEMMKLMDERMEDS
ncbi:putative nicotinamide riboside kinase 1 protein [Botrytis fragariae]|uniref:Putative nicotinamide riboside kinase 1 protein n=1 Tax=Botrytis fragariae TaxID=1964551 RepID=A0A8H6B1T8_9HELO|nr:putative nicotinamide riboside kinase 1 protein [Botrytis fragariae]KAF5877871.1 putative nicotinamide riboside kinase 1 protein [Botrytis fragariae]